LQNSILSENTEAIHFLGYNAENYVTSSWSDVHGPIVTNSNGSFIWGEGSINEDPLFEGTGDHPYTLALGSPCIDAGTPDTAGLSLPYWDIIGNQRIWDGDSNGTEIIDMGAYEFGAVPVGMDQFQVSSSRFQVEVYPNPTQGIVDCQFSVVDFQRVSLKIYDLHGREVAMVVDKWMPVGEHVIKFDVSDLPAGFYFIRLYAGKQHIVKKLIRL
jgi:hypothetical protein